MLHRWESPGIRLYREAQVARGKMVVVLALGLLFLVPVLTWYVPPAAILMAPAGMWLMDRGTLWLMARRGTWEWAMNLYCPAMSVFFSLLVVAVVRLVWLAVLGG